VRDGDLKLVVADGQVDRARPALYDLAADISETTDLAAGRAE
jgi:hypothetical protein